ncbi:hypothetical protein [Inquilinus sp.]|uniref:hypothetical protein n=1 Tax=Inquilinus sp. TaxID=1932117 RepID=UPI003784F4D3
MLGELMVFAATEAVVFVATALVFSGPDPADEDDEIAPLGAAVEAAEARGRPAPASQPSGA